MRDAFVVFLQQWQVYKILNIFTCTAVFILKKRFWDKCFNPKVFSILGRGQIPNIYISDLNKLCNILCENQTIKEQTDRYLGLLKAPWGAWIIFVLQRNHFRPWDQAHWWKATATILLLAWLGQVPVA